MSLVTSIKSKKEFDEIRDSGRAFILDANATWCGPCRVISPIFEKLAAEVGDKNAVFGKFDVDEVPDLTEELGIRAMPTFVFYKDGKEVDRMVGANPQGLQNLFQRI